MAQDNDAGDLEQHYTPKDIRADKFANDRSAAGLQISPEITENEHSNGDLGDRDGGGEDGDYVDGKEDMKRPSRQENIEANHGSSLAPRKMSSTSNPIYFLHVGKTGGTSMDALMNKIKKKTGRKYIGFKHFDWSYIQHLQKIRNGVGEFEGEYDVSANADVITFLRHPVSRAYSQFYFSKGLPWAKRQKAKFRDQTFDEYIQDIGTFRQPIADGEGGVRFLAGAFKSSRGSWIHTDGVDTELKQYLRQNRTAACLRAAERLDQTTWFGILEDIDRSMKLLQLSMDLDEVPTLPKMNKNRGKGGKNPKPSDKTIAKVKQYIPQDLWLYEYAKRLFEARWDYFNNANGDGIYIHPQLPPLPDFENKV